jgi:HxlR-like helix-turn-helix
MPDRQLEADRLVHLLSGRWTIPLLGTLARRGRRYQELHNVLDGISNKVLTDTLRRAERDGLITRHLDAGRVPLRVDRSGAVARRATCRVRPLGRSQLATRRGNSPAVGPAGRRRLTAPHIAVTSSDPIPGDATSGSALVAGSNRESLGMMTTRCTLPLSRRPSSPVGCSYVISMA